MAEMDELIAISWRDLSADALQGLLEEFVTRDGTDYGEQELSQQQKVEQVMVALRTGEARILFSPETAQCDIVLKNS